MANYVKLCCEKKDGKIMANLSVEQAREIFKKYNKEPFHFQHSETVGKVMGYFAKEYNEDVEYWTAIGILHDVDFGMYPQEHCKKCYDILRAENIDDDIINSIASHAYGICSDVEPTKQMEKILFAIDELTGLIGAAALMRPSKSVEDMELKSLKKKFKDKKFAAGCDRETIRKGAENLGWELDELLSKTLVAMQATE